MVKFLKEYVEYKREDSVCRFIFGLSVGIFLMLAILAGGADSIKVMVLMFIVGVSTVVATCFGILIFDLIRISLYIISERIREYSKRAAHHNSQLRANVYRRNSQVTNRSHYNNLSSQRCYHKNLSDRVGSCINKSSSQSCSLKSKKKKQEDGRSSRSEICVVNFR